MMAETVKARTTRFGTPLFNDIFFKAQPLCEGYRWGGYVNGDIILTPSLIDALEETGRAFPSFLAVGSRYNVVVPGVIRFAHMGGGGGVREVGGGSRALEEYIARYGFLDDPTGMDYFISSDGFWTGGLLRSMPDLAIGRYW
jgi:hypothetical protein